MPQAFYSILFEKFGIWSRWQFEKRCRLISIRMVTMVSWPLHIFMGIPLPGKMVYILKCICKLYLMWTCCVICNHTTCLVLCRLVESESIILIIVWQHWRGIIIMCPVHHLPLCQILIIKTLLRAPHFLKQKYMAISMTGGCYWYTGLIKSKCGFRVVVHSRLDIFKSRSFVFRYLVQYWWILSSSTRNDRSPKTLAWQVQLHYSSPMPYAIFRQLVEKLICMRQKLDCFLRCSDIHKNFV